MAFAWCYYVTTKLKCPEIDGLAVRLLEELANPEECQSAQQLAGTGNE